MLYFQKYLFFLIAYMCLLMHENIIKIKKRIIIKNKEIFSLYKNIIDYKIII